jgi:hypothetical protein
VPSRKQVEASSSTLLAFCLAYSSALKMEAVCCSDALGFIQTTYRYKSENRTDSVIIVSNIFSGRDLILPKIKQVTKHIPDCRDECLC